MLLKLFNYIPTFLIDAYCDYYSLKLNIQKNKKCIKFKNTKIYFNVALSLFKYLNKNKTAKTIIFENNYISVVCYKLIIDILSNNKTIKNVIFKNNRFENIYFDSISSIITENSTITHLMINEYFQEKELCFIMDALKVNKTIKNLAIKDESCSENYQNMDLISDMIKENSTIKTLHLNLNYGCNIKSLANALKINNTIKSLNLEIKIIDNCSDNSNNVSSDVSSDFHELLNVLQNNKTIKYLHLNKKIFPFKFMPNLIKHNNTLIELGITNKKEIYLNDVLNDILDALKYNNTIEKLNIKKLFYDGDGDDGNDSNDNIVKSMIYEKLELNIKNKKLSKILLLISKRLVQLYGHKTFFSKLVANKIIGFLYRT